MNVAFRESTAMLAVRKRGTALRIIDSDGFGKFLKKKEWKDEQKSSAATAENVLRGLGGAGEKDGRGSGQIGRGSGEEIRGTLESS